MKACFFLFFVWVGAAVRADGALPEPPDAAALPLLQAAWTARDFGPDGKLDEAEWTRAKAVIVERESSTGTPHPELATKVRALWSAEYLYLGYECPFTKLSTFDPPQPKGDRIGMWDRDVVEAFISPGPEWKQYGEFEWAPNGDHLDLAANLPKKDFGWNSGMESAVSVDEAAHVWRVEVRIPMKALAPDAPPAAGTRWRINLFRHDTASGAGLAFSPTLTGTFHTPERFGWLEFGR